MSKVVAKAKAARVSPAQFADKAGVVALLGLGVAVAVAVVEQVRF